LFSLCLLTHTLISWPYITLQVNNEYYIYADEAITYGYSLIPELYSLPQRAYTSYGQEVVDLSGSGWDAVYVSFKHLYKTSLTKHPRNLGLEQD